MSTSNKKKIILGFLILGLILIIHYTGMYKKFTFECFKQNREYLLNFVDRHYLTSVLGYIILYILTVVSSFPLAGLLTVVGGFLFGVILGTIYTNIGGVIGAILAFLMFRYFFGETLQEKYGEKLEHFNKNIDEYGAVYLLILHVMSVIPFFIINILASLTKIPLKTFIWTTSLGIIPGSIVYAYAGKQLCQINSMREIFSIKVLISFALLGCLGLISLLFEKYKNSKQNS